MATFRPVGPVTATAGTPTPVYTGPSANLLTATSFSILSGIATIVVDNTYLPGNQVGLFGFTTATYFNGVPVTVLDATAHSFRFYFNHVDVNSTGDTGKVFIQPSTYRAVRIELQADASTHHIYVGDGTVTSDNYVADLTLAAQKSVEIDGNAINAGRIHIDTDSTGTEAQISLVY